VNRLYLDALRRQGEASSLAGAHEVTEIADRRQVETLRAGGNANGGLQTLERFVVRDGAGEERVWWRVRRARWIEFEPTVEEVQVFEDEDAARARLAATWY
jgi:hypothetical protein